MLIALVFLLAQAPRETPAAPPPAQRVLVKAAHLIDGRSDSPRDGLAVLERVHFVMKNGEVLKIR
jgi:hypothetical protein